MGKLETIYVLTYEEQDEPSRLIAASITIFDLQRDHVPKTFGEKEIKWKKLSDTEIESSCGHYKITKVQVV